MGDPQGPGPLALCSARGQGLPGRPVEVLLRPAQLDTLGPRVGDAVTGPANDGLALQLGKERQNPGHKFAVRVVRVSNLPQRPVHRHQGHVQRLQLLDNGDVADPNGNQDAMRDERTFEDWRKLQ